MNSCEKYCYSGPHMAYITPLYVPVPKGGCIKWAPLYIIFLILVLVLLKASSLHKYILLVGILHLITSYLFLDFYHFLLTIL